MKETAITTKLIQKLNLLPNCYARKRHGSAYCSGDPDIHICFQGLTIFVEMKVISGELSDLQAVMLQRWQDAGATCILAVYDTTQKSFSFFINPAEPCSWKNFVGKVKPLVSDARNIDIHCNARYDNMLELLNKIYAKNENSKALKFNP